MYAVTDNSYRVIASVEELQPGERAETVIPPELFDAQAIVEALRQRNALLRACDWTQVSDSPLDVPTKEAWGLYRQELRDLPQAPGFPNVDWPQAPDPHTEGEVL